MKTGLKHRQRYATLVWVVGRNQLETQSSENTVNLCQRLNDTAQNGNRSEEHKDHTLYLPSQ